MSTLNRWAQTFNLLSDPTRLKLLKKLRSGGALNVGEICIVVKQTQPGTSHHLSLLRHSGLVESTRSGKNNYYDLTDEAKDMLGDLLDNLPDDETPKPKASKASKSPKTAAKRSNPKRDAKGKVIRDARAPETVEA